MQSADTAIRRWVDVTQGKTTLKLLRSSSVFAEGDKLYSFGHHFELARVLRDSKGKIRLYLLNGDRVSQHTTSHQSDLRNALLRGGADAPPKVIIPYPALEEAGIVLDSISLIDDKPERTEKIKHRSHEFPEGAHWHQGGYHTRPRPEADVLAMLKNWNAYRGGAGQVPEITLEEFMTDDKWEYYRYIRDYDESMRTLHRSISKYSEEITVTVNDDRTKTYEWTTHRHWLGESLIRARVEWIDDQGQRHHRWACFLSGFDHQEPTPLYFLAELPYKARPQTVDEAYEVLKPDPVLMAEQMGRDYTRQGDIFAIPTRLDRKALIAKGARVEKLSQGTWREPRAYILNTNHAGTEVAYLPGGVTLARGCLYHRPRGREADHVRRKLGDGQTWHLLVKNTVPTAGRK